MHSGLGVGDFFEFLIPQKKKHGRGGQVSGVKEEMCREHRAYGENSQTGKRVCEKVGLCLDKEQGAPSSTDARWDKRRRGIGPRR